MCSNLWMQFAAQKLLLCANWNAVDECITQAKSERKGSIRAFISGRRSQRWPKTHSLSAAFTPSSSMSTKQPNRNNCSLYMPEPVSYKHRHYGLVRDVWSELQAPNWTGNWDSILTFWITELGQVCLLLPSHLFIEVFPSGISFLPVGRCFFQCKLWSAWDVTIRIEAIKVVSLKLTLLINCYSWCCSRATVVGAIDAKITCFLFDITAGWGGLRGELRS